jgi:hypothetical protein
MAEQNSKTLISFTNGSYKEVSVTEWRHSNWVHFRLPDGSKLCVNPDNVNYLHVVQTVKTEAT